MIRTVLVANRGEIARRVIATCRALGIATVAVHSDADASAPHVREADVAVRLPGLTAGDTYLRGDLLVAAALRAGADALHPGYGFLSENAEFADSVQRAGLVWIGPAPDVIAAMGSKTHAKKLMDAAGVPVLRDLDPQAVTAADLPVLVKAAAGGGGRGMRVVRRLADLPEALTAASTEAASAFGDGSVFVEPFVERGRHVEVQVLADRHATVWALGERECSIQRRHQKVLEESPSPVVEATPGLRERLFAAAVTAASVIGYVGAGTMEFLVDGDTGRFFFLEVNTRLQVEHPVTEARFGVDLVHLQLAVADGATLDPRPPEPRGHAIEVRLYAEDPAAGWAPQTGTVQRFDVPAVDSTFAAPTRERGTPVLRLDSGIEAGSVVEPFYDAMLAKLVVWAPTRAAAAARLASGLASTRLHGLRTNRDLLVRILRDEVFLAGAADTTFLEGLPRSLGEPLSSAHGVRLSAVAAALALAAGNRGRATVLAGLPGGWRNIEAHPQRKSFLYEGSPLEVEYRASRSGPLVDGHAGLCVVRVAPDRVVLDVDGLRLAFDVAVYERLVCVDSALGPVALVLVDRFPDASEAAATGSLLAPMPGTVVRIGAVVGEQVQAGRPLVWLEAMKMEHVLLAPADGVLTALAVQTGQQVEPGTVLAVVSPHDEGEST